MGGSLKRNVNKKSLFMVSLPYHLRVLEDTASKSRDDGWRLTHMGRLMWHALRRFDQRVLELMAHAVDVPLALSNLAARGQIGAAHVQITRHLPLDGARLTELAQSAGISKQAMADLVDQCEAWGLVRREADPLDARARRIAFTAAGLEWLEAFRQAVQQAEAEFREQVGPHVATVVALGLEVYASGYDAGRRPARARGQVSGRSLK